MNARTAEARSSDIEASLIVEASRLATEDDLMALTALGEQARVEMRTKRGGAVLDRLDIHAPAVALRMSAALTDSSTVLAVGTLYDVPVGYGVMVLSEAADGSTHAVIEEIFVDPDARSIGVGEALADLFLNAAADRGALGVDSLALPGDRATKNFFETQGMVARGIVVHRKIGDR